jgi:hypothetical protein
MGNVLISLRIVDRRNAQGEAARAFVLKPPRAQAAPPLILTLAYWVSQSGRLPKPCLVTAAHQSGTLLVWIGHQLRDTRFLTT